MLSIWRSTLFSAFWIQLFLRHVTAEPNAESEPALDKLIEREAQSNIYAPFSGAIYIVGPQGSTLTNAAAAQCPANAPQNCGNINVWNWCCPSGNSCQMMSNGVVGCCAQGSTCGGTVNAAQIQTVTVTATAPQTVVQVPGGVITTTVPGAPANGVYVTTVSTPKAVVNGGPYCSTQVMAGAPLPTFAAAACGTILILPPNAAGALRPSAGTFIAFLMFSLALMTLPGFIARARLSS
ncbi:hypothetical protein BT63DRAFT_449661 [Microthyrium microscopicum]|uniref:Uncharacterized protein n=1 Tax=Microthyrium microscopicum TaxID=703497 RepID=A0A6A6UTC2_9PEZI|nr:hypothetical protein BT63DRAFT_449661 [Microthyrium microscopicum]